MSKMVKIVIKIKIYGFKIVHKDITDVLDNDV